MSTALQIQIAIDLFSALIALLAIWKGGVAERWAGGILIGNMIIGVLGSWLAPDAQGVIRLCNDGLAAVLLLVVTVRYAAPWMGGVMLFYAAQFAMHSYYLVSERQPDYLYTVVNNINWSSTLWCLLIGALLAWRRRVKARRLDPQPAP